MHMHLHLSSVVHFRWGPFVQHACLWHIGDPSSPIWDAKLLGCFAIKRQCSALFQIISDNSEIRILEPRSKLAGFVLLYLNRVKVRESPQQQAFAHTTCSADEQHLAGTHLEVQAGQNSVPSNRPLQVVDFQQDSWHLLI